MVKKLFALASVTALGGFVAAVSAAGCTSTEVVQQTADSGATDGGSKRDAKPPSTGDDEEPEEQSCKAKITFTPDDVNPPKPVSATACTPAVIDALAAACIEDLDGTDCKAARDLAANKTCAECVFSAKTDAQWGPIVLYPGETPNARFNQAGCVDHATGVNGCGATYLTIIGCFNDFCAKCPENEISGCVEEVAEGECADYRISDQKCGAAIQAKEEAVDGCFPAENTKDAYLTFFKNVATIFCAGQPAGGDPDAG